MIKCLLTEFGRAGWENIWLSVRTHGPRCTPSVQPRAKYFPVRPSHSVNIILYKLFIWVKKKKKYEKHWADSSLIYH